jgi:hypothetical protein
MPVVSHCAAGRDIEPVPFTDSQEAWFWFVEAMQAKQEGARIVAGLGKYPRPCEPVDIYKAVERLHRSRRLLMDHLLVMRHYGQRLMPPDPRRIREVKAFHIWRESMDRLSEPLIRKGIVQNNFRHSFFHQN